MPIRHSKANGRFLPRDAPLGNSTTHVSKGVTGTFKRYEKRGAPNDESAALRTMLRRQTPASVAQRRRDDPRKMDTAAARKAPAAKRRYPAKAAAPKATPSKPLPDVSHLVAITSANAKLADQIAQHRASRLAAFNGLLQQTLPAPPKAKRRFRR